MRSYALVLAPLIGFSLLSAQEPASSTRRNPFEAVPEAIQPRPSNVSGPTIQAIEFRGARRLPQATLRAIITSRAGGVYDLETLRRDAQALQGTGRFSNVAWETEMTPAGAVVHFVVVERPVIRWIEYQGDAGITIADVEERFKQRNIKLRVETLYNHADLEPAAAAIQGLIAERSRRDVTVTPQVESAWPHGTVKITFRIADKQ